MSNSNFRLQSFGTSSAFVPNTIDEAKNVPNSTEESVNKYRSTGPVVTVDDPGQVCFYAVKFDTTNITQVNTLDAPIRNLDAPAPTGLQGSFLFYSMTGTVLTAITGPIGAGVNSFSIMDETTNHITIGFPTTTLPPANQNPIYLGLKLKSTGEIVFNGQYTGTGASDGASYCILDQPPTTDVEYSYTSSIVPGNFAPELYVSFA